MSKLKCWKKSEQWKFGFSNKQGDIHVHVFPATLRDIDGGKHQVDIWQSNPYKKILMRTKPSEKQAESFALKYMKDHDRC